MVCLLFYVISYDIYKKNNQFILKKKDIAQESFTLAEFCFVTSSSERFLKKMGSTNESLFHMWET